MIHAPGWLLRLRTVGVGCLLLTAGLSLTEPVGLTRPLSAQSADVEALDRFEARIEAGRTDGVAEALDAWLADAGDGPPDAIGRARYLRARLIEDVDLARAEYLSVAIEGGTVYGALAWLRLAQMDLAMGEPARAASDLERLRADYPGSPSAASSWYWTARTFEDRGLLNEACEQYERAISEARRVDDQLSVERALMASGECGSGGLRFSIQVGAFSRDETARELQSQLEADGHPARVFEDGGLYRVRVGWFANPDAARALERRLRDGGFTVAVVAAES